MFKTFFGDRWGVQVTSESSHLLADQALVAGAQAGDRAAMDALISVVRPAVFRFCRARLASYAGGADADDVAQEICVAVFKVLPQYQDNGAPFAAWVFAIAANKIADAQRRFRRSAVLVDEFPDQVESSPTPEERMLALAHVRAAFQLIQRLPQRVQQVVMMRAHGVSADMVGEHLGMSANAVRVAQHRGLVRLRQLVEESEEHRELFAPFLAGSDAKSAPSLSMAAGF
jgi:RNA polymerase sigma-70 factor (ECF subfamily)